MENGKIEKPIPTISFFEYANDFSYANKPNQQQRQQHNQNKHSKCEMCSIQKHINQCFYTHFLVPMWHCRFGFLSRTKSYILAKNTND